MYSIGCLELTSPPSHAATDPATCIGGTFAIKTSAFERNVSHKSSPVPIGLTAFAGDVVCTVDTAFCTNDDNDRVQTHDIVTGLSTKRIPTRNMAIHHTTRLRHRDAVFRETARRRRRDNSRKFNDKITESGSKSP